jgi:hypothetical protein
MVNVEITKSKMKMFIKVTGCGSKASEIQELDLHLKKAAQILMLCENNFETFINETLYFKQGKFLLKDFNKSRYESHRGSNGAPNNIIE